MQGTLTFLGTGTSMGVPTLGCACEVCTSPDPHDRRLRPSVLIRWSEAKNAAGVCGCKEENLHFLDLPFYQTGTIAKRPITAEDVAKVRELLERLRPDQVYVAGDLSDFVSSSGETTGQS